GSLAGTGICGLLYLVRPPSKVGQGLDGWRRAGGMLGALVGNPLRSLAGLILAVLAFVGGLILFRLSFDQVWRALKRAAVAIGHGLGTSLHRLTTLSGERKADGPVDVVANDLHTVDTAPAAAPRPRRFRAGIDHDEEEVDPDAGDEAVEDPAAAEAAEDADLTAALTVDLTDAQPAGPGSAVGEQSPETASASVVSLPAPVPEDLVLQSPASSSVAAAPKQLELGLVPAEQRWQLPADSCL